MTWIVYSVPGSRPEEGQIDHHVTSDGSACQVEMDFSGNHPWEASIICPPPTVLMEGKTDFLSFHNHPNTVQATATEQINDLTIQLGS